MIDCDYYSSARDVLNYIKPYLQKGTIIIFDDWYAFKGDKNHGEQKAFNEFLNKNKDIYFIDFPTHGCQKMFIYQGVKKDAEDMTGEQK